MVKILSGSSKARVEPVLTDIVSETLLHETEQGPGQCRRLHAETDAVWAAMRAIPIALSRGDTLVTADGASGLMFRIRSGWAALIRPGSAKGEEPVVVELALPGDLVGATIFAASGATAAVCLGPVVSVAAGEAVLRDVAIADIAAAAWLARQEAKRQNWAEPHLAGDVPGSVRRRVATLLSRLVERLEEATGTVPAVFLLPLDSAQLAGLLAASPEQIEAALKWLLDVRVLSCAHPTLDGVAIGLCDRTGLRALGQQFYVNCPN